jgi:alkylation response protein AidB-like acyl-CoA dehydrogenase
MSAEHERERELNALRKLVTRFARKEISPRIRELEQAGEFPRELYRRMGELGFFGPMLPDDVGGTELGYGAADDRQLGNRRAARALRPWVDRRRTARV